MENKDELLSTTIPDNIINSKRYFGFRARNIIEGIILSLVVILIIIRIPFVTRIKIIFIVILGMTTFILSCVGIKDKSVSELLIDLINYTKLSKNYSYRSINNAKKSRANSQSQTTHANQSPAEKTVAFIKEKYNIYKQNRR